MLDLVYPVTPAPVLPRPSADNPGFHRLGGEMLPVVEPGGLVVAQASRENCHALKLLHPVVYLHLVDREGRIYLQKRSPRKDSWPGCWDVAVGGHIGYGEGVEEALYREAAEELGLKAFLPQPLESYVAETVRESELAFVFGAVGRFNPSPDPAEVTEGRWFTFLEAEALVARNVTTPAFAEQFTHLGPALLALL